MFGGNRIGSKYDVRKFISANDTFAFVNVVGCSIYNQYSYLDSTKVWQIKPKGWCIDYLSAVILHWIFVFKSKCA